MLNTYTGRDKKCLRKHFANVPSPNHQTKRIFPPDITPVLKFPLEQHPDKHTRNSQTYMIPPHILSYHNVQTICSRPGLSRTHYDFSYNK